MIDPNVLREKPEVVREMLQKRNFSFDLDHLLEVEQTWRQALGEVESLRAQRNNVTQDQQDLGRQIKEELKEKEVHLRDLEKQVYSLQLELPNLINPNVPEGEDETGNVVLRQWGEIPHFEEEPKDHLALGQSLDLLDFERAGKVSGSRFYYLKNEAVLLEFALVQLVFRTLQPEGFIPLIPPVLIHKDVASGLGYWQAGQHNEYYLVTDPEEHPEGLYLVGTAEHAVVPMHQNELLDGSVLPLRYVAFSSAFRREAGSYGKDTRGLIRTHQFDKVEMVTFVREEESAAELQKLLSLEEKLLQSLNLPYQVIQMCVGDLGFPAAEKYDLEAWFPSQKRYRELTSTSTTTDYQARRLNIRYKDGDTRKYVHIQNGTGLAIGRTLAAIVENYQQADGSLRVPEVLQEYVGKEVIVAK